MSDFMQWMTHGIKRGWFEINQRTARSLSVLFVVLSLIAALYLTLVSRTAARGRHIQQLQVELFHIQRDNEQLEVDIAIAGSIPRVRERALDLGLAPAEQIEFLEPSAARLTMDE